MTAVISMSDLLRMREGRAAERRVLLFVLLYVLSNSRQVRATGCRHAVIHCGMTKVVLAYTKQTGCYRVVATVRSVSYQTQYNVDMRASKIVCSSLNKLNVTRVCARLQ